MMSDPQESIGEFYVFKGSMSWAQGLRGGSWGSMSWAQGLRGVNDILGHFLFVRSFLDPILELMSTHSKKA